MLAKVFPVHVDPQLGYLERIKAFVKDEAGLRVMPELYQTLIRLANVEPASIEVGEKQHLQVLGIVPKGLTIPKDTVYFDENGIAANNRVCWRFFMNCLLGVTFRPQEGDTIKYAYRIRNGAWRRGQAVVIYDAGLYVMCQHSRNESTMPVVIENIIEVKSGS